MPQINELIEIREDKEFNRTWWWTKSDIGAWNITRHEWLESHHIFFFKYLRGLDVCITAGANHGIYTHAYSQRFKYVYAFEPDPVNFYCMVLNNPSTNVIKINAALSSAPGLINLNSTNSRNTGEHKVVLQGNLSIPSMTIDMLGLHKCDLIQLDTEGYEWPIILGAKRTIERLKPVVIAENGKRREIADYLGSIGYVAKDTSFSDTIWVPKT